MAPRSRSAVPPGNGASSFRSGATTSSIWWAMFASSSRPRVAALPFKVWSPLLERLDHEVLRMWQAGEWKAFCEMLPEYAVKGHGEGFMHDTAMLLGALGWSSYDGKAEVITPYFGASGTGQVNALFPVTPQDGATIPRAQASNAQGYEAVSRL